MISKLRMQYTTDPQEGTMETILADMEDGSCQTDISIDELLTYRQKLIVQDTLYNEAMKMHLASPFSRGPLRRKAQYG